MVQLITKILVEIVRAPVLFIAYLLGWHIEGTIKDLDRVILLGVPHTTAWDYALMLYAAFHQRRRPHVTAKQELFKPPIGWFIRAAGGISIDRSKPTGASDQIAERLIHADRMMLIFTPEGTRNYRQTWRSGFYFTSLKAQVPIALAYADYKNKILGLGKIFYPTGDIKADFAVIREFYMEFGQNGKYPEKINDLALDMQKIEAHMP